MSNTPNNNKQSTRKAAVLKGRQNKRKWSTLPDLSNHPYFVKKKEEAIRFLNECPPPGWITMPIPSSKEV